MIDLGPAAVFAREIKPLAEIVDQLIDEAVQAADRVRFLQISQAG